MIGCFLFMAGRHAGTGKDGKEIGLAIELTLVVEYTEMGKGIP